MEFPFFNQEGVKELIIKILSSTWPISVKEISSILRKGYNVKVSYQAVHKAVNELLRKKILTKNSQKSYELNTDWIKEVKQFSLKLEQSYLQRDFPANTNYFSIQVNCLWDLYQFILYNGFVEDRFDIGNRSVCVQSEHVWISPIGTEKEWNLLKKSLKERVMYVLVKTNTPLDKMQKRSWESLGMKYKLGVSTETGILMMDLFIFGDYIIQIYFPPEFVQAENKLYSEKTLKDIKLEAIQDVFYKKTEINIVVQRNRIVAEKLRKRTEREFITNE
ncbi:MAG: hypothetical protein AABX04_02195 [Nanoarchaeota archaeon]